MKDLEKDQYDPEEALDESYLKISESKPLIRSNNATNAEIDYLYPKNLEDASFEIQPYWGHWDPMEKLHK